MKQKYDIDENLYTVYFIRKTKCNRRNIIGKGAGGGIKFYLMNSSIEKKLSL